MIIFQDRTWSCVIWYQFRSTGVIWKSLSKFLSLLFDWRAIENNCPLAAK